MTNREAPAILRSTLTRASGRARRATPGSTDAFSSPCPARESTAGRCAGAAAEPRERPLLRHGRGGSGGGFRPVCAAARGGARTPLGRARARPWRGRFASSPRGRSIGLRRRARRTPGVGERHLRPALHRPGRRLARGGRGDPAPSPGQATPRRDGAAHDRSRRGLRLRQSAALQRGVPGGVRPAARRPAPRSRAAERALRLRLAYRPPWDWGQFRDHFALRALTEVERVHPDRYARTFRLGSTTVGCRCIPPGRHGPGADAEPGGNRRPAGAGGAGATHVRPRRRPDGDRRPPRRRPGARSPGDALAGPAAAGRLRSVRAGGARDRGSAGDGEGGGDGGRSAGGTAGGAAPRRAAGGRIGSSRVPRRSPKGLEALECPAGASRPCALRPRRGLGGVGAVLRSGRERLTTRLRALPGIGPGPRTTSRCAPWASRMRFRRPTGPAQSQGVGGGDAYGEGANERAEAWRPGGPMLLCICGGATARRECGADGDGAAWKPGRPRHLAQQDTPSRIEQRTAEARQSNSDASAVGNRRGGAAVPATSARRRPPSTLRHVVRRRLRRLDDAALEQAPVAQDHGPHLVGGNPRLPAPGQAMFRCRGGVVLFGELRVEFSIFFHLVARDGPSCSHARDRIGSPPEPLRRPWQTTVPPEAAPRPARSARSPSRTHAQAPATSRPLRARSVDI